MAPLGGGPRLEKRYRKACAASLSYAEVGATREGFLPDGYHHVERRVRVGSGAATWDASRAAVRRWAMQRRVGFAIHPAGAAPDPGVTVLLVRGLGPLHIVAPARVVWSVDDPGRSGFGYGTLPGHPERGEEAFVVERDANDEVWFTVRAFSRHATWYTRIGGIVARQVQQRMTQTYVNAVLPPERVSP